MTTLFLNSFLVFFDLDKMYRKSGEISHTLDLLLRPVIFDVNPREDNADRKWIHWRTTFENFLEEVHNNAPDHRAPTYALLINHVSPDV